MGSLLIYLFYIVCHLYLYCSMINNIKIQNTKMRVTINLYIGAKFGIEPNLTVHETVVLTFTLSHFLLLFKLLYFFF